MTAIEEAIRSCVPGRVRVRHEALKNLAAGEIEALRQTISAVDGVQSVRVNPRTGSLLLYWDVRKISDEELLGLAQWLLAGLRAPAVQRPCERSQQERRLDALARMLVPGVSNIKRARRMAKNRVMLGLGAASVASLAFSRRLHGVLGWAFALMTALHANDHRRVL